MRRSAGILGVQTDAEGADEIARRSRGTPRIANRLLRRVRDFAEVRHDGAITGDIARAGLELFEVDEEGLDRLDHAMLCAIVIEKFGGGPVGLCRRSPPRSGRSPTPSRTWWSRTCCSSGSCKRTPRGRVATDARVSRTSGVTTPGTLPL